MQLEQRVGLPSLKSCDRAKLRVELGIVNEAVKRIQTHNTHNGQLVLVDINKDFLFSINSFFLYLAMLARTPIYRINSNDCSVNGILKEK